MSEGANFQKQVDAMKDIQNNILHFLEDDSGLEEYLKKLFKDFKIKDNQHELLLLMHLISNIGNNHHRFPNFFSNIEKILLILKKDIQKYFSNLQIFNIFEGNKRILLFLIEKQFIVFDENIARKIVRTDKYIKAKYPHYFQSEIAPFINEQWFPKYNPDSIELFPNNWVVEIINKELPENFNEKRSKGENDSYICELIRNDSVEEFIRYVNRNQILINASIGSSIYETNSFLVKKQFIADESINLIEYAAFFGSIQIFNFLKIKGAQLRSELWYFAIHGKNSDIIHCLEDFHVKLYDKSYIDYFFESIKCHNNDIANYFLINFVNDQERISKYAFIKYLKYYNFAFLNNELINLSNFIYLCKYDYCSFVDVLLKRNDLDINKKYVYYYYFSRH